jgi:F-type H+-transporting ATPase subunit b
MAGELVAQENSAAADAHGATDAHNDAHSDASMANDGHGTTDAHGAADTHGAAGELHEGTEAHGGGEAHSSFPPFDSSTFGSQLLWLAIAFGALYLLMSRVALPRIGEILEVRRDRIEGDLAEAERMRQKTDQALADYEQALAGARSKAQGIAEDTRNKMKAEQAEKRSEVEADLARKMADAEARIQATKAEALGNVDEIATDTVQALVQQLLGKVPVKTARDAVAKMIKGQA